MSFDGMLKDRVTIYENNPTSDGKGGLTPVWTAIVTDAKCRLYKRDQPEKVPEPGQTWYYTDKMAMHKPSVAILGGMKAAITEQGETTAVDYVIMEMKKAPGYASIHHIEIQLRIITDVLVGA